MKSITEMQIIMESFRYGEPLEYKKRKKGSEWKELKHYKEYKFNWEKYKYRVKKLKDVPMNLEEIFQAVRKDSGFVKYRDENNNIHLFQLERLSFNDSKPLTVQGKTYTEEEFIKKFTRLNGWRFEKNEED